MKLNITKAVKIDSIMNGAIKESEYCKILGFGRFARECIKFFLMEKEPKLAKKHFKGIYCVR